MSCQPCGCDPEAGHVCAVHAEKWLQSGGPTVVESNLNQQVITRLLAPNQQAFIVKDSGQRKQFDGGFVRDVTDDKIDYTLIQDGTMYDRWAIHLTKGAVKYGKRNWLKASDQEAYERFREGFARHARQVMRGDIDEDHKAACFFNLDGMALMEEKLGLNK